MFQKKVIKKKMGGWVILGMVLTLVTILHAQNGNVTAPKKLREWTVMAYFDSNNDLDSGRPGRGVSYVLEELKQLEKVQWTPEQLEDVAVIALYASLGQGCRAQVYRIGVFDSLGDTTTEGIRSKSLTKLGCMNAPTGSVDMSQYTTLAQFIQACQYYFPAKHYALILMDHGRGWKGVCYDDRHGEGKGMFLHDLAKALDWRLAPRYKEYPDSVSCYTDAYLEYLENSSSRSKRNRPPVDSIQWQPVPPKTIDVIFFAACLMSQVEVAYELSPYADYMVASEDLMWPMSTILPSWLDSLIQRPLMSSKELAFQMANSVYDAAEQKGDSVTISVIDLGMMDTLAFAIKKLVEEIVYLGPFPAERLLRAQENAFYHAADEETFVDLKSFISEIEKDPLFKVRTVQEEARSILVLLPNKVVTPFSNLEEGRCGISIYFPPNFETFKEEKYDYYNLRFAKEVGWHDLISEALQRQ